MNLLYLGPSLGGGILALVIGFITTTVLFLLAIFIKPIRFIIGKLKKKK